MSVGDNVFLFGDSHAGTIAMARRNHWGDLPDPARHLLHADMLDEGTLAYNFVLELASLEKILNPVVTSWLARAGLYDRYERRLKVKGQKICICLGFADSHLIGFHPGWRGYSTSFDKDQPGLYVLPSGLLQKFLKVRHENLLSGVRMLVESGALVSLLFGPPPHIDGEAILKARPQLKFIAPSQVRLDIFQALRRVFLDAAKELGFEALDGSASFSDANGFLRAEFESDGVHGNDRYGRVMLDWLYSSYGLV